MRKKELVDLRGEKTQVEVARLLGITQAALSRYEQGKRPIPESIAKLARILLGPDPP